MMKKIFLILLISTLIFSVFSITASADTGPKPSVRITLEGLDGREAYVTLLSAHDRSGPWASYETYPEKNPENMPFPEDIFMKFVNYEDSDGYHFLQYGRKLESNEFAWTYYPPTDFKLLIYFPDSDSFVSSGIYEKYAFDSYFTADLSRAADGELKLHRSYDYSDELISLLARIVITVLSELLLAYLAFGYRGGRLYALLAATNALTQIILNVTVNIQGFYNGRTVSVLYYALIEAFIFITEAIIYYFTVPKLSKKPARAGVAAIYAISANLVSLILGVYLAWVIPSIF